MENKKSKVTALEVKNADLFLSDEYQGLRPLLLKEVDNPDKIYVVWRGGYGEWCQIWSL